jgi:hypothetical protein
LAASRTLGRRARKGTVEKYVEELKVRAGRINLSNKQESKLQNGIMEPLRNADMIYCENAPCV